MKLLICGVPGAGKTTFGDYLQFNEEFEHYNFEDPKRYKMFVNNYISNENIVVTWGFVPDYIPSYRCVESLLKDEYVPIWFDDGGRRERSYKMYLKRKGKNTWEENYLYFRQIFKIDKEKPEEDLHFKIINPFKNSRQFKDAGTLFEEIKKAISSSAGGHSYVS